MIWNRFHISYTSNTYYTFYLFLSFAMSHPCVMPTITYATLWAKWQIVIPKEARDKLHVWPWDKVVLIIEDGRLMVINPDGVQQMITILQEWLSKEEEKKVEKKIDDKKKKKTEKKK